ncbi:MAG: ADP-ribosylglycohydrolase family protein [Succinivibrio sp.]|nr:ADP-ribosylglycohydrolase family protein [Succinivibrio sp.]
MGDKLFDKIRGALYGVAVGDALGGPLEFMSKEEIIKSYGEVREIIGGGWLSLKPGETTDDTAMTLAVARGIATQPDDPLYAVGKNFIDWFNSEPKDIGNTCQEAIEIALQLAGDEQIPSSDKWIKAAVELSDRNNHRSGGNGALMRTVYPGLFYNDREKACDVAVQIGDMTHADELSDKLVSIYTELVYDMVRNGSVDECLGIVLKLIEEKKLKDKLPPGLKSSGWCADSMKVSLHYLVSKSSFEDTIVAAVNEGGDSDTVGAVCGGLAGALYGFECIPERWVKTLSPTLSAELERLSQSAFDSEY